MGSKVKAENRQLSRKRVKNEWIEPVELHFVLERLKIGSGPNKYVCTKDLLYQTVENVLEGAQHFDTAPLNRKPTLKVDCERTGIIVYCEQV